LRGGSTTSGSGEVELLELEQREWQDYKKALMDALQVAVQTSSSVRTVEAKTPGTFPIEPIDGVALRQPSQDELVLQCLGKLNRLESDIFDRNLRWQAKRRELEPVGRQIEQLREMKSSSMAQLHELIQERLRGRRRCLGAGLREVLPPDSIAPEPTDAAEL